MVSSLKYSNNNFIDAFLSTFKWEDLVFAEYISLECNPGPRFTPYVPYYVFKTSLTLPITQTLFKQYGYYGKYKTALLAHLAFLTAVIPDIELDIPHKVLIKPGLHTNCSGLKIIECFFNRLSMTSHS